MKVRLQSTTKTVELHVNGAVVPGRVWEGETEDGIRCAAVITRIGAHKDDDLSRFEAELRRQPDADPVKGGPAEGAFRVGPRASRGFRDALGDEFAGVGARFLPDRVLVAGLEAVGVLRSTEAGRFAGSMVQEVHEHTVARGTTHGSRGWGCGTVPRLTDEPWVKHAAPGDVYHCKRHHSWLCGAAQGECQREFLAALRGLFLGADGPEGGHVDAG